TQSWSSFDESFGIGHGSMSALGVKDGIIWAATAYTASTSVGYLPAGGGVGFSSDDGYSWTWFDQPVDSDTVTSYSPTTVNIQNVTYDLLITSTEVWITSWAGGLRKFSFADSVWHLVTPDTFAFSALNRYNHRAFSVVGDDSILWVGTAAGVNKSVDGGATWQNYNHNQHGLSGNFVTALGRQQWSSHDVLWAATWQAEGSGEYNGVTKTENGGITWQVVLADSNYALKAHNFAFDDSIVYVASNLGLYKSVDGGQTWGIFTQIRDAQTGELLNDPEIYSVYADDAMLWAGTGDGIASSNNYGNTWTIHRSFLPSNQAGQPATYAYPNPFSPRRSPFVIRFQYDLPAPAEVTVRVYDFAMEEVTTVAVDQYRSAGDHYEIWDGRRSSGDFAATGVYYYVIERGSAASVWGKFAIIH
ncbi:MAG: FlgD immunoglobulin-like domain containing protein, partial [bacterium]